MSMKTPRINGSGRFHFMASQPVEDTECPKQGTTRYAGDYDRRVGLVAQAGFFCA